MLKKGQGASMTSVTEIPETVAAPVEAGQELGQLRFLVGEQEIGSLPLVAADEVEKRKMGASFSLLCRSWVVAKRKI